jgi:hypothetical protein
MKKQAKKRTEVSSLPREPRRKLSADEADAVISHRRLREKRFSLEEVIRRANPAGMY